MSNPFFDHPIPNSPYEIPQRHWELDAEGQPTQKTIERRRRAEFITPIPKPRKRKAAVEQENIILDVGKGLSGRDQQYDSTWNRRMIFGDNSKVIDPLTRRGGLVDERRVESFHRLLFLGKDFTNRELNGTLRTFVKSVG